METTVAGGAPASVDLDQEMKRIAFARKCYLCLVNELSAMCPEIGSPRWTISATSTFVVLRREQDSSMNGVTW
jgi:hypothetical protein